MEFVSPRPRPRVLPNKTYEFEMGCGRDLYITITLNSDEHNLPFETFIKMGKAGDCYRSLVEALGIAISLYLRAGGDPYKLVKSLRNIRCPYSSPNPNKPTSCADAIARALEIELGGE
jgi:hypothetical protein